MVRSFPFLRHIDVHEQRLQRSFFFEPGVAAKGSKLRMTSTVSASFASSCLGLSISGASSPACFDWQLTHPIDVQTPYNCPTVCFAKSGSHGSLHTTGLGRSTTQLIYAAMDSKLVASPPEVAVGVSDR